DDRGPVLLTRADDQQIDKATARNPNGVRTARTVVWRPRLERPGRVLVVTAGTADLPVAEECTATLTAYGFRPHLLTDVGVAGVHRLTASVDELLDADAVVRSEEHTSELQSRGHLVCRLLLEKKNIFTVGSPPPTQ